MSQIGLEPDITTASFFLLRHVLKVLPDYVMRGGADKLFISLTHTAADASEYL